MPETVTPLQGLFEKFSRELDDLMPEISTEVELLSLVAASVPHFVAQKGSGKILSVHPMLEKMFGYRPGELQGEPFRKLVPPRVRNNHASFEDEFYNEGRWRLMGDSPTTVTGYTKHGVEIPVSVSLRPVRYKNLQAVLAVVLGHLSQEVVVS